MIRRIFTLLLVSQLFLASAALGQEAAPRVLLIGESDLTRAFRHPLEQYGADIEEVKHLSDLNPKALDHCTVLVICAPMEASPPVLTKPQSEAIMNFVQRGGRAFIEYTRFAEGVLPGWKIGQKPILNRFERIAVLRDNVVNSGLEKDDLLEEHNVYLLEIVPPSDAEVLMTYGLYLGTYKITRKFPEPSGCFFTITVDLGQEVSIQSAEQWYGGLTPGYVPDSVRLSLAGNNEAFEQVQEITSESFEDSKVRFPLKGSTARYVRFYVEKEQRSHTTDFVVLNGIEIYDINNQDVAKGKPYILRVRDDPPQTFAEGPLTRGEKPRPWSEDRSHLYPCPPRLGINEDQWNALIKWNWAQGRLYYAAHSFSSFRRNHYRPGSRWESLIQGICLSLFPEEQQAALSKKILPLRAYTTPRRWILPGTEVEVHIISEPGIKAGLSSAGITFSDVQEIQEGHYLSTCTPPIGEYGIRVTVSNHEGENESLIPLSVQHRKTMYRRALDRNMQWFLNSGVLPNEDGSKGVRSGIELGGLFAGPMEDLPSAFRADCQSMTGKVFYMYGDISKETRWHLRAENLAQQMMEQCQFLDPSEPSYGAWQWLFEGNPAIYAQDDNNRNSEFLSWLYTRTGKAEYLKAALRNVEYAKDGSREDSTLTYWVTNEETVNSKGRASLRGIYLLNFMDYNFYRYHYAYRATGDPIYRKSLEDLIRIYGGFTLSPHCGGYEELQERGLAIAIHYLDSNDPLREQLISHYISRKRDFYNREDVKKYGFAVEQHDISKDDLERAYTNDSSIHTFQGEPLSDQLYTTAHMSLTQWEAYKAFPNEKTRMFVESLLDYLVRIQCEDSDRRLDGCWMRSFDMEHWEYYGTRYDPNYGAYHAYTGWMNAIISTALAYYLLDENPFAYDKEWHLRAAGLVKAVRKERVPEYLKEVNHLKQVELKANREPDLGSHTTDTLTDGVIEGYYTDHLSAGWSVPEDARTLSVILEGDLGHTRECCRMSVRVGGLNPEYCPESIVFYTGDSPDEMHEVLNSRLVSRDGSNWFELELQPFRYIKIQLTKSNSQDKSAKMYLGEIQLIGIKDTTF